MVFKKYSKRATKYVPRRRRYRKKRYNKSNAPSGSPFPIKCMNKLTYVEQTSTNPGSVTPSGIVFRANGLYDPNLSGAGHQPRGFDEYMNIYERWLVIGGKVRVDVAPTTTPVMMYMLLSSDSTSIMTNPTDYSESRNVKKIILGANSSGRTVYYKYNPNKFMVAPKPMSTPNLQGTASVDPTRQCYLHVAFVSLDGSDPGSIPYQVTIDYSVIFHTPKKLIES